MLPAANRPIIEYVLDAVIEAGIDEIHLVVGYKRERVQSHFGPTYRNVDLTYHVQEKQLGSGHALLTARDAVDEPFLVVNGDQIADPSIAADVIDTHDGNDAAATLSVMDSEKASQYGVVEMEDGHITDLVEQPSAGGPGLLNAGVYAFSPDVFEVLSSLPRLDGTLTVPQLVSALVERDERSVAGVFTEGFWTDATFPWDLLSVAEQVFRMEWIDVEETSPRRWVADSAAIHPDAVLEPPVVVGEDTEIGAGAVVGPLASVGENTVIGANAVISNTVVDANSRVGPNATLVDAALGRGVMIGAGSVVPGGDNDVQVNGRVHEGRRLGAVIADRTSVGGGTTVGGGSLVGSGATLEDGVTVSRNVDNQVEVRR
ncbi:sugar phosphate nucleotidyltransferase [Halorubrum gandharaense]